MHEIMRKVCDALESIENADWSVMSEMDRKAVMELVDLKKNLLKIEQLEDQMDSEYSLAMAVDGQNDMGDGYSNRSRHWVRGHYSRDGRGGYSRNDGYSMARNRDSRGRYSRSGSKEEMMGFVDDIMESAPDERYKKAIMEFKEKLERM